MDDRTKLPQDLKTEMETKYSGSRFTDVGRFNVHLQESLFEASYQPNIVVVNQKGEILGDFDYMEINEIGEFIDDLEKIVDDWNN